MCVCATTANYVVVEAENAVFATTTICVVVDPEADLSQSGRAGVPIPMPNRKRFAGVQTKRPAEMKTMVHASRVARVSRRGVLARSARLLAVFLIAGIGIGPGLPVASSEDALTVVLTASGLRGAIWFPDGRDKESGWIVGGDRKASVAVGPDGSTGVEAPVRVADRVFRGWKQGKRWLTKDTRLGNVARLPRGTVLTAVYEPALLDTEPVLVHFSMPNQGRWATWPRTVHVDPKLPSEIRAAIWEGIRRWDLATGGAIRLDETRDGDAAEITVVFANLPGDRSGQTTTKGRTAPDGRFDLEKARVALSTALVDGSDKAYLAGIAAVASHEIGHALGLSGKPTGGHSDDPRDTMTPVVTARTQWPTARDINSLAKAYPLRFPGR